MDDQHDQFSPSASLQWLACPVSIPRTQGKSEKDPHPSAQWGTDSHALLEKAINLGMPPLVFTGSDQDSVEKAECAEVAWNYVQNHPQDWGPVVVRSEVQVDPGSVIGVKGVKGTADIIVVTNSLLEVADLKTGRHIVEPDSPQIGLYLLGALNDYWPNRALPCPFETFCGTIIQPRAPHINGPLRSKEYSLDELFALERAMELAVTQAQDPNAVGVPGEKQCRWCLAKGDCSEHKQWMLEEIIGPTGITTVSQESIGAAIAVNTEQSIPADQLSHILSLGASLEAWLEAIRLEVKRRLEMRQQVPGWKLVKAQTRPKWILDEADLIKKFKGMRGVSIGKVTKLKVMTPLQAMRAVSEEVAPKVEKLWERPEGTLTIAPQTDPRDDALGWVDTIKTKPQE